MTKDSQARRKSAKQSCLRQHFTAWRSLSRQNVVQRLCLSLTFNRRQSLEHHRLSTLRLSFTHWAYSVAKENARSYLNKSQQLSKDYSWTLHDREEELAKVRSALANVENELGRVKGKATRKIQSLLGSSKVLEENEKAKSKRIEELELHRNRLEESILEIQRQCRLAELQLVESREENKALRRDVALRLSDLEQLPEQIDEHMDEYARIQQYCTELEHKVFQAESLTESLQSKLQKKTSKLTASRLALEQLHEVVQLEKSSYTQALRAALFDESDEEYF